MPNIPSPKPYGYASWIPGRRPEMKLYPQKGHAINAVHYGGFDHVRGGIVYEYIDGEWINIHECKMDYTCIKCGVEYNWSTYRANHEYARIVDRKVKPKCAQRYIHDKCREDFPG
jgi:hypothetical protein